MLAQFQTLGEYNRLTDIYKIVRPLHSLKVWFMHLQLFIKGWMMC